MNRLPPLPTVLACAAALAIAAPLGAQAAPTIFDDFDVDEGHFNLQPTFSGTTVGILTTSTADRVTTAPLQGAGCEQLVLINNSTATSVRVRFLSGGGSTSANIPFTTTAGTDGWIGYYVKTTNTGWVTSITLDGAAGNIAAMDGGVDQSVIADGQWHLYEWDLDSTTDWGVVNGIGGGHGGALLDEQHTIDSIYFRNTTAVPDATSEIFLDYVARNDTGSVSNLLVDPCNNTSGVLVGGPISTDSDQVVVLGVDGSATAVTVYQDTGSGMTSIGTKTTDITAGQNTVTVSGLVKGATVAATQTVSGQESCVPTTGLIVGGGANSSLRLALSIRENLTATGPVGANGSSGWNNNIHFIPCTTKLGSCPGDGTISITPGTGWQDVSVSLGRQGIGSSANAAGTLADDTGIGSYFPADTVAIQVYAFKTMDGTTIYSPTAAESAVVTSNANFVVNWTWDAVSGAEGYRLLRNYDGAGFVQYQDVGAVTSLNDPGYPWVDGNTVTPTAAQTTPSRQWYPVDGTNNIAGEWGVIESIALVSDDPTDSGPFKIYIDDLANGTNGVFQDFEGIVAGTATGGLVFDQPSFSGTTGGNILDAPNDASVVNEAAYSGTKSQRAEWQFVSPGTNLWLRFTTYNTSVMPSPQVNLSEPISFKILVVPVGVTPTPPPQPVLSVDQVGPDVVLTWTGAHNLQTSVNVSGTYTNVPGVTVAPYTNNFPEPTRFFRLAN